MVTGIFIYFSKYSLISRMNPRAAYSQAEIKKDQVLDRLVLVSSDVATFTPPAYQPCVLQGVLPSVLLQRWGN